MRAAGAGLFFVVWLGFMALAVGGTIFWVFKIVEVAKIPEHQYRAAGSDKTTWILVVALAGAIGALIWQFAKRAEVLAAAGRVPSPPPGWYPEPGTSRLRWWDGVRWTEYSHGAPPPSG